MPPLGPTLAAGAVDDWSVNRPFAVVVNDNYVRLLAGINSAQAYYRNIISTFSGLFRRSLELHLGDAIFAFTSLATGPSADPEQRWSMTTVSFYLLASTLRKRFHALAYSTFSGTASW